MIRIGAIAVLGCLIPFGAAWADEASKAAKVEEMFQVTKSEAMMERSLAQVRAMQQAQAAKLDLGTDPAKKQHATEAINKVVAEHLGWEKLKPRFVALMAEAFTDEELDGILAFYRSPAGKAMVEKMPQFMGKTMGVVQAAMQEMQPEIQRIIDETKTGK
ncbi:MAG TPA: DUF2059 domain-containing protein [Bryobacteraceae bacterium]|nr:DUF2059 domain-containing protein [Bryobacteraceae bacterium]